MRTLKKTQWTFQLILLDRLFLCSAPGATAFAVVYRRAAGPCLRACARARPVIVLIAVSSSLVKSLWSANERFKGTILEESNTFSLFVLSLPWWRFMMMQIINWREEGNKNARRYVRSSRCTAGSRRGQEQEQKQEKEPQPCYWCRLSAGWFCLKGKKKKQNTTRVLNF